MKKRVTFGKQEPREWGALTLGIVVLVVTVATLGIAFVLKEYAKSIVINRSLRTTLAVTTKAGEVQIISFDPAEKNVTDLTFADIEISSRSVGKYKLSQLYRLGSYESKGGAFVKRKMQGFLRIPITDYLIVEKLSSWEIKKALLLRFLGKPNAAMSRLDATSLFVASMKYDWREIPFEKMVKEGAIVQIDGDYVVNNSRLLSFVGNRLFDWQVGGEGKTVTVINETGVDGLGNDVASFLNNVGLDVVAVRSGATEVRESTLVKMSFSKKSNLASAEVLRMIFGEEVQYIYDQDLAEFRSDVVVWVGNDALEMY